MPLGILTSLRVMENSLKNPERATIKKTNNSIQLKGGSIVRVDYLDG